MLNITLLTLFPFIALFVSELIWRGSIDLTLSWMTTNSTQFYLSYAILFGIINTFYLLPRKIYGAVAAFLVTLFSLAGYINLQKLLARGEPLMPWDFSLGREALSIAQNFEWLPLPDTSNALQLGILAAIIIFILLIAFFVIPKEKYSAPPKLVTAIFSFTMFFTLTQAIPLERTFSLQQINWSQKTNFEENGMLLALYLNSQYLPVNEPGSYEKDTINDLLKHHASSPPSVDADFSPNIIIVMSEAFWDPTVLEGVSFSKDPLPYFHSLQRKHTSGLLLTPVYGGATANTEFEVLTGFSTQFLPQGMVPYAQLVNKPLEGLPALLNRQGYETTAIHTYEDWFYHRNTVYPHLGFNRFISKDSFVNPEYYGPYIRDTELSRKIIDVLNDTAKPDFIFALSMQAHGPYSNEKSPDNTIKISSDPELKTEALLENYTNIIADVDKSLKLLIESLKKINEPSIVLFFGDHLPMLGNDYDVYKETGYFKNDNTYANYLNKYSVPIIVWDNFSDTRKDIRLSSSFLGSYILASSMNAGNPMTDFLYNLSEAGCNVLTSGQFLQYENITEKECTLYELLQYDLLLGRQFARES